MYRFAALHPAEYSISAVADRHLPTSLDFLLLRAGEDRIDAGIVMLLGGVEISGTVSDLSGGPIVGAMVSSYPGTTYKSSANVETDEAGAFRMGVDLILSSDEEIRNAA